MNERYRNSNRHLPRPFKKRANEDTPPSGLNTSSRSGRYYLK